MDVVPVERVLADAQLQLMPLRALIPTRDPYNTILLQPKGAIEATDARVGNADKSLACNVCRAFLSLAVTKHTDLAITPEYCLPWSIVDEILEGGIRPDEGAMWILGCESITPDELDTYRTKANAASIFFYHEPIDEAQKAKKRYIDPLAYVFWSINSDGLKVLTLVVQFKTAACKDSLDVELRSLYLGTKVYSFNRGLNKIGLLSIICSDAFGFTNDLVDQFHANCLLIHIQLNPKPAHADYAAYRTHLHAVGSGNHVELLCLNWARDVVEVTQGNEKCWNNVAGSAWYVPAPKFSGNDELVNDAHHRGIYYSIVSQRWHAFYLNYEPQVLLIQKQKLMLFPEPQALQPKSCLSVVERWCWETVEAQWVQTNAPDDGLAALLATYPALLPHLTDAVKVSPLAVERAVELLMGPAGKARTWFHLDELPSMKVETEESISRVTVHQESDPTRRGVIFRRTRLQRAQDAMTLAGTKLVP